MRVAIVGSRDFPYPEHVTALVRQLLSFETDESPLHIVSGGAPGADTFAVDAAGRLGVPYTVYPVRKEPRFVTRWQFSQAANARNKLIVEDSDVTYAFPTDPDKVSPGTKNALNQTVKAHHNAWLWNSTAMKWSAWA